MTEPMELILTDGSRVVCDTLLRSLPGRREVYAGRRDGDAVVVKRYLDPRRATVHAAREAEGLGAFAEAGIAAPALLFHGVDDTGRPVIVVRRLPGVRSLKACWSDADQRTRGELLTQMMQVLAGHHAAGICQRDLHLGNFLVGDSGIYSIDGDAVDTWPQPLGRYRSVRNLALFCAQFLPDVDAISVPASAVYANTRGWSDAALRDRLPALIAAARRRRWRSYRTKLYRACSDIAVRHTPAGRCLAVRPRLAALAEVLERPDASCPDDPSARLKDGNTATVWRASAADLSIVIKRYNVKSWRHGARMRLKESRASVSWRNAHRLAFFGIATAAPLALIRGRHTFAEQRNYWLSAEIAGDDLAQWLRQHADDAAAIERMAAQVGAMFARLHALRIAHGDTKATNFLVADGQLHLIDLDAMKGYRNPLLFARAWRRDMRRFLANWPDDAALAALMRRTLEDAGVL